MRILLFGMLVLLLTPFTSIAQIVEGKIIYRAEVRIEIDDKRLEQMTEEQRNRMKERMKSWGKSQKTLEFNQEASIFRNFQAEKDAADPSAWEENSGRRGSPWRRMRPQSRIYLSHADQNKVEQREAFDKKFIIKAPQEERTWKITGNNDMVAGALCMEAVCQENDSTTVKAWFTPTVPISAGPAGYGGLPGMILRIVVNDNEQVIEATEVRGETLTDPLVKPDKGKEVTKEEFAQIMEEKRKEMREIYGNERGRFGR